MADDADVTLHEVYRLLLDIRQEVRKQNGRVSALEQAHERIKAFGFFGLIAVGLFTDWLRHKLGLS